MKPAVACHLLSKFGMFTWVGFWTIRFKNLIISFHQKKSPLQYTSPPNFHCFHKRLPPSPTTPPPPPIKHPFSRYKPKQDFIFSCSHSSCTIFIVPLYSLHAQVMLILILINVQYLQIVVFSFEKCLTDQNYSSSGSHQPMKQSPSPQQNFSFLSSYSILPLQ